MFFAPHRMDRLWSWLRSTTMMGHPEVNKAFWENYERFERDMCKEDLARIPPTWNQDSMDRPVDNEPSRMVKFVYRNWKGEIKEYHVLPEKFEYGRDTYHNRPQWLLHAVDVERGVRRTFALADMLTAITEYKK